MHNLSDDELDRLSREAAEQFTLQPGSDNWSKVADRLNQEMPAKRKHDRRIIGLLLFLLLIGGMGILQKINRRETGKDIQAHAASDRKPGQAKSVTSPNTRPVLSGKQADEAEAGAVAGTEPSASPGAASPRDRLDINLTGLADKKALQPANDGRQNNGKAYPNAGKAGNPTSGPESAGLPVEENQESGGKNGEKEMNGPVIPNMASDHSGKASAALSGNIHDTVQKLPGAAGTEQPASGEPMPEKIISLEIGLTYSPDFSNIGFASPDQAGINAGFTIGWNINERWSVQSGLLYAIKHYTATGEQYTTIPGYIPGNPNFKMTEVKARCRMLDFPVNLRYNWLLRPRHKAFAAAGLSSWFMLRENIDYYYTYYNNQVHKVWENQESSAYWFTAANISAGYEYRLKSNLSLQAEPFVKLSIREAGSGNLHINSLGMFLTLKYLFTEK
jgi:hypothetical protein